MTRKIKKLTKKELEQLKDKLVTEKRRLSRKDVRYAEEFNLKEEDRADELDQASVALQNAQELRFRNREVFYERKIDEALRRIEDSSYGLCEECEGQIGFRRLWARPTADLCIVCKEDSERDEHLTLVGRQSKSFGKVIDLVASI